MNDLNKEKGITLVSLVVTIIILLILVGVTLVVLNGFLTDKIATVSSKTEEAFLKEKIEMAFMEVKAAYWEDKETTSMSESEYFVQELKKSLENTKDINKVSTSGNIGESIMITLTYGSPKYQFEILSNGEINLINPLIGNVKIGDYVEYPVEYTDIYSETRYTSINGWRVIDDGVMEGTSGYVKIISTGIPVKWHYDRTKYKNAQDAIDSLMNHFEDNILLDESTEIIEKTIFKVDKIASKVTTVTLSDLNKAYNAIYKTNRELNDTSIVEDNYKLFNLKSSKTFFYWLATKEDGSNRICYFSDEGIYYDGDVRMGIRPVIYLQNNLNCKLENNVWKITE